MSTNTAPRKKERFKWLVFFRGCSQQVLPTSMVQIIIRYLDLTSSSILHGSASCTLQHSSVKPTEDKSFCTDILLQCNVNISTPHYLRITYVPEENVPSNKVTLMSPTASFTRGFQITLFMYQCKVFRIPKYSFHQDAPASVCPRQQWDSMTSNH